MIRAAAVVVLAALAAAVLAALLYDPDDGDGGDTFTADDLEALLAGDLDPLVVADAVGGFGRSEVADGGSGCRRIRFEMATTMDNLELNEALSLWIESHPASDVEAADGRSVTLRLCP